MLNVTGDWKKRRMLFSCGGGEAVWSKGSEFNQRRPSIRRNYVAVVLSYIHFFCAVSIGIEWCLSVGRSISSIDKKILGRHWQSIVSKVIGKHTIMHIRSSITVCFWCHCTLYTQRTLSTALHRARRLINQVTRLPVNLATRQYTVTCR